MIAYSLRKKSDGSEVAEYNSIPDFLSIPDTDITLIGADQNWSNDEFEFITITAPDPEPAPIKIEAVTPRQARLALSAAGLLDSVDAAVQAADKTTQITW